MDFLIPSRVGSDLRGYDRIAELYYAIGQFSDEQINLDFINTQWFEANLAAILGAICTFYKEQGKEIKIKNLNSTIEDVLCRNHFLCEFNYDGFIDSKGTILTYKKFSPYQDIEFLNYIDSELLSKPDFPKHSKTLGKKISESIFELFENARTHGNCKNIFTCGQYYPSKTKGKRLDFTVVDLGITIKRNVTQFLNRPLSGYEAIEWAMEYGNTTKTGNVSGGLGLDIVKSFIKLNQGKIQIVSADGFFEYANNTISKNTLNNSFAGTIVNIEFNLNDKNTYQYKENISLDNIF